MKTSRLPNAGLLTSLWVLLLVVVLCSYATYRVRRGEWGWAWQTAPLTDIRAEGGMAFGSSATFESSIFDESPVPAVVVEDARGLFPTGVPLDTIRAEGGGRYRIDGRRVYFSSLDGSDPRSSGHRYYLWYAPIGRTTSRIVYAVTAVTAAITFAFTLWLLRLRSTREYFVAMAVGLPAAMRGAAQARSAILDTWIHRRLGSRGAVTALVTIGVVVIVAVVASQVIFVMRSGQWTSLWRTATVEQIEPEQGLAFRAVTGREEIGSHYWPSPAGMFEDGRPLGLRNATHADIRTIGGGRYSFWYDYVYFTASDNTDPRANGRRYTFSYPPVSRTAARAFYSLTAALIVLGLVGAVMIIRSRVIGEAQTRVLATLRARSVAIAVVSSCLSLASIGMLRALPATAPLVSPLWAMVVALNIVTAAICYARFGRQLPLWIAAAFTVAVAVCFYALTVLAPHRSQGCHTTDPLPVWSAFCVAPDSSSYYFGYKVGSTRQPLYPWMIDALTRGTGFEPTAYLATATAGAVRSDPADPLYAVVHAQILLLLLAALVATFLVMGWVGTPLAALAFAFLYDQQYFSANELNIVLTEPLVQTFVILATGMYAAFLTRMRPWLLLGVAVACGLAYLTRQAAIYMALPLFAMMALAFFDDWRRWWSWSAAAIVLFVSICAVPDLYAFATTGQLSRQQESLQYQYRIAHAMQYATTDDVALMPDEESRTWLADAIVRRDEAHRRVDTRFPDDELNRMIYYIAGNLYEVATPIAGFRGEHKTPEFYMKVATPILQRHWMEYARFSFRFWQFGITRPGLARLAMFEFSVVYVYVALAVLMLVLRSRTALAAAVLVVAHWGAVAIICLAAVPIPRMIGASEFLVVVAALAIGWEAAVVLMARILRPWHRLAAPGAATVQA